MNLKISAMDVQSASDYLTEQARSFVVTGEDEFIFNYMNEGFTNNRREKALETIKNSLGETESYKNLASAVSRSKTLMDTEYYAMHLAIDAFDKDYNPNNYSSETDKQHCLEIQQNVLSIAIKAEDISKTVDQKKQTSIDYMYNETYHLAKDHIGKDINDSIRDIENLLEKNVVTSSGRMRAILVVQQVLIFAFVSFLIIAIIFIRNGLTKPIGVAVDKILKHEELNPNFGLKEYAFLCRAYN